MRTYYTEYYIPTFPHRAFCGVYKTKTKSYNYNHTYSNSSVSLNYGHVGSSSNLETGFARRVDFLCAGCGFSLNSCVVPGGSDSGTRLRRKRRLRIKILPLVVWMW